jgi:hypothetical protein
MDCTRQDVYSATSGYGPVGGVCYETSVITESKGTINQTNSEKAVLHTAENSKFSLAMCLKYE